MSRFRILWVIKCLIDGRVLLGRLGDRPLVRQSRGGLEGRHDGRRHRLCSLEREQGRVHVLVVDDGVAEVAQEDHVQVEVVRNEL